MSFHISNYLHKCQLLSDMSKPQISLLCEYLPIRFSKYPFTPIKTQPLLKLFDSLCLFFLFFLILCSLLSVEIPFSKVRHVASSRSLFYLVAPFQNHVPAIFLSGTFFWEVFHLVERIYRGYLLVLLDEVIIWEFKRFLLPFILYFIRFLFEFFHYLSIA